MYAMTKLLNNFGTNLFKTANIINEYFCFVFMHELNVFLLV